MCFSSIFFASECELMDIFYQFSKLKIKQDIDKLRKTHGTRIRTIVAKSRWFIPSQS